MSTEICESWKDYNRATEFAAKMLKKQERLKELVADVEKDEDIYKLMVKNVHCCTCGKLGHVDLLCPTLLPGVRKNLLASEIADSDSDKASAASEDTGDPRHGFDSPECNADSVRYCEQCGYCERNGHMY